MTETKHYIAVDLGAESGRVMLGSIRSDKLTLQEVHRFGNGPLEQDNTLRWDFAKILGEIKTGLAQAIKTCPDEVSGIAVDSWGVDYGLIGADGELLEKPYHYRDGRTDGILEKAFELMPQGDIYENTGVQFMAINTAYQLLAMRLADSPALAQAKTLLFTADLYAYHLCGEMFTEYSLASTSQLLDMKNGQWSRPVFEKFCLPLALMLPPVKPGTIVGQLTADLADEFGCGPIPVIAAGSHDTAGAVAAAPAQQKKWAYLSSGTWSLMGVEIPHAIVNDKTFGYQFTNEGGVENSIRLLKNIMGLWLLQECRRQWQREGTELTYGELAQMAGDAKPFGAFIDPGHDDFVAPGDMPAKINRYLAQTGQAQISDKGQMARAILESLALKYRQVMGQLEDIIGYEIEVLHIVGGGIQNELLNQFAADATGKDVIAGPIEATASGSIIMQAIADGQIESLAQGRQIVRNSYELQQYRPQATDQWQQWYDKTIKQ